MITNVSALLPSCMFPLLLQIDDLPNLQLGQLTGSFNSLKPTWSSADTHWPKDTMAKAFVIQGKKTGFKDKYIH